MRHAYKQDIEKMRLRSMVWHIRAGTMPGALPVQSFVDLSQGSSLDSWRDSRHGGGTSA